jgi:CRISPR-associated endonuclease Csn1
LAVAFTTHSHIQYINNLNARKDTNHKKHNIIYAIEKTITERINGKPIFKEPIPNMRDVARKEIESIIVSYKAKNKVTTNNINKTKLLGKQRYNKTLQSTPRGQLHKETVYGRSLRPMEKPIKLNSKFNIENVNLIIDKKERDAVILHLSNYANNDKFAFDNKSLKNNPILLDGEILKEVRCFEEIFTIRKPITSDLKINKVIDDGVRKVLEDRLKEFNGNIKEAFSNLEENPIWLNEEKGVSIKRVTITGVNTATPLHYKKDHLGNEIENSKGERKHSSYVQTGNNHHVAIYRDGDGNLQESVISFYEAVERKNQGLPIIDKSFNSHLGWEFLFTMKQNEIFVFPSNDFDPTEIDLLNPENYKLISKNLYRVQKISTNYYTFRHHLETTVTNDLEFTFKRIRTPNGLKGIIKVRINHIGKIEEVGEY